MTAEIDAHKCLIWLFCVVSFGSNKSRKYMKKKKVIFLIFYPLYAKKIKQLFTPPVQPGHYRFGHLYYCAMWFHMIFYPSEKCICPFLMEGSFFLAWVIPLVQRYWISKLKHSLAEVTIQSTMIVWICSSQLWSQCGFLYIKHLYTTLHCVFASTERPLKHSNSW